MNTLRKIERQLLSINSDTHTHTRTHKRVRRGSIYITVLHRAQNVKIISFVVPSPVVSSPVVPVTTIVITYCSALSQFSVVAK